jgi:polar amino acid transport system permease protein
LPEPDKREIPWWLIALAATAIWLYYEVWANGIYAQAMQTLAKGIGITVFVTVVAYSSACVLGLLLALAVMSRWVWLRQLARLWIEVVRGVPIIVLLLYVAFVISPVLIGALAKAMEYVGLEPVRTRDFPLMARAIIALTIAYSAFLAEIFRAGLQAVDEGQVEAAESLGLSAWLRFRLVVFPQAFRTILPPLGNDFVAMVKDSSLVSVLGVSDITQLGKVTAAGNFRYFETYNIVALLYLTMTIGLSLVLRRIEQRLKVGQGR